MISSSASTTNISQSLSIILPCYNEAQNLESILTALCETYPHAEVIVVDDGSTDESATIAHQYPVRLIKHPHNMGNGACIKTGARHAKNKILVFMDADGQHKPEDIQRMLNKLEEGYDMVVGARTIRSHANISRMFANAFYNKLASFMTGFIIKDLTSGFRVVKANKFRKFLYLLPNGFSYPTTSTMAFFRSAFPVAYIPIAAEKREGKSKIRLMKDGMRFLIIILRIGALFSPMRLFLPISLLAFLIGSGYYAYTFFTDGRFTNMSALLYITSLLTFLIGIVSEQISSLHYRHSEDNLYNDEQP